MSGTDIDEPNRVSTNLKTAADDKTTKYTTLYFLKQRQVVINLIVMSIAWTTVSFCYYLISFQLKYFPGNIFVNSFSSGISEIVAYLLGGVLFEKMGLKGSLFSSFLLGGIGGVAILINGQSSSWTFPFFVIIAKFGIASAFCIVYVASTKVFVVLFAATALGICNFFSRIATITAPVVAEIDGSLPMIIFTSLSFLASITSLCVIIPKKEPATDEVKSE